MPSLLHPLQFVLVALAGWMNERQRGVIEYLHEENRGLREQLGRSRLRFTDGRSAPSVGGESADDRTP
jgi:hypothetical protein